MTLNFGRRLLALRKKANMTQEELAAYMGVSKSSVSKWENQTTLPDIALLPQLATLFNSSIDELLGYEPQLDVEAINRLYVQLAKEWGQDAKKAFAHCEELIRKYYSCFPFLVQMAGLYLNHHMIHPTPQRILERCEALCERVIQESGEDRLLKEAISLKSICLLTAGKPREVLALVGEEVDMTSPGNELIAMSYQMMGDEETSSRIYQFCIYQHLLSILQVMANYLLLNLDKEDLCDATMERMKALLKLFHVDALHTNTAAIAYTACAKVYAYRKDREAALQLLEHYVDIALTYDLANASIHNDAYFTEIETLMDSLHVRTQAPREAGLVHQSMIQLLLDPSFAFLKEEHRYQACLRKLQEAGGKRDE